ncbi:MAG: NAD(P)-dependent oxidoreductase [Thermus sp.]|uniref:SDR family oxidoreductase n=1 Tax=Thermus TaxID=270 RepID=UPI001FAA4FD8|nr:NAD(P)-dependent oxidoreductase [Thermus thalpophilus]
MRLLLTGGTGRLGQELVKLLPGVVAPPRAELDITRPETVEAVFARYCPEVVVHAAAYTDVASAERERALCWQINVEGTKNLVEAAWRRKVFFIHISTDYVFEGTRGMYREDDTPGPVRNYYALTKLVAESLVRLLPRHLVIRTSFRPNTWPYPVAFTDLYTSQDYLDVIAPEIALAILRHEDIPYTTLHIATERKSAYDLARRRNPHVRPGSRLEADVALPEDISLDTSRWQRLKEEWGKP